MWRVAQGINYSLDHVQCNYDYLRLIQRWIYINKRRIIKITRL